jgi:hypothetical protein
MLLLGTYSRAARLLFICEPASSRNRDFRLKRMKKIGLSRRDLNGSLFALAGAYAKQSPKFSFCRVAAGFAEVCIRG